MAIQDSKINNLNEAFEIILDAIVTQKLAPGEKVSENIFNERFGISRTISRNLIERLTTKYFLTNVSQRVTQVSSLTLLDIKQNFMLRKLLIPDAFALASSNINLEQLTNLHEQIDKLLPIADDESALKLLKVNKEVNLAIISATGYPLMLDLAEQLENMAMRIYWLFIKTNQRYPYSPEQQTKMFEFLKNNDPVTIKNMAHEMLTQTEERIINVVFSNKQFCNQNLLTE